MTNPIEVIGNVKILHVSSTKVKSKTDPINRLYVDFQIGDLEPSEIVIGVKGNIIEEKNIPKLSRSEKIMLLSIIEKYHKSHLVDCKHFRH